MFYNRLKCSFILTCFLLTATAHAQLKPNFDVQEYLELLRISRLQIDTVIKGEHIPQPVYYQRTYRSPAGPLKNRWELWESNDHHTAVISIRGSTADNVSWLENFYAAMVPASGTLHISDNNTFNYHLADDPRASVHIGWLLGMADISATVVQKINLLCKQGVRNFIIMGHSQGGAIAYLLRSHLRTLQQQNIIPANIAIKTYCSAPPKPGNTYYAYDYDYLTRGGWGIAVINAADWVPETPFSIQTFRDFNDPNPFGDVSQITRKQSFFIKLYIRHVYNQLKNPPVKAQKNNEKYLGHMVYKFIKKELPQLQEPAYAPDNLYTHAGTEIILMPDSAYRNQYPDKPGKIFTHHMFGPYYDLTEKEYTR